MTNKNDLAVWRGRVDESPNSFRWHQRVRPADDAPAYNGSPVVIGFECDEGVRRNQGRPGAKQGPNEIRKALANLACSDVFTIYDAGNVTCDDDALENAQESLSCYVQDVLSKKGFPIVLGGGHEVGWGSFLGLQTFLSLAHKNINVGIINFDAHFDLRSLENGASSGTPFRQCNEYCSAQGLPFNYFVLGINPSVNTEALFDYAGEYGVKWVTDLGLHQDNWETIRHHLENFIRKIDVLYLTVCLDVFNSSFAPGVSAPAALGIHPALGIRLIKVIQELCQFHDVKIALCDIAEMNPLLDRDGQTAKLAARIIYEILN